MKIKGVRINNRTKCFEIDTAKGEFRLPFSRCELVPSRKNKVVHVSVDKELGSEAITYQLESGAEDSIPLDAFLDYNRDPEYLTKLLLYRLTLDALQALKKSGLKKREVARKLHTSPAQLYRLLDTTNHTKTIDQMVRLLAALGCEVEVRVKAA